MPRAQQSSLYRHEKYFLSHTVTLCLMLVKSVAEARRLLENAAWRSRAYWRCCWWHSRWLVGQIQPLSKNKGSCQWSVLYFPRLMHLFGSFFLFWVATSHINLKITCFRDTTRVCFGIDAGKLYEGDQQYATSCAQLPGGNLCTCFNLPHSLPVNDEAFILNEFWIR